MLWLLKKFFDWARDVQKFFKQNKNWSTHPTSSSSASSSIEPLPSSVSSSVSSPWIEEPTKSLRLGLEDLLTAKPIWGAPAPLGPGASGSKGNSEAVSFPLELAAACASWYNLLVPQYNLIIPHIGLLIKLLQAHPSWQKDPWVGLGLDGSQDF